MLIIEKDTSKMEFEYIREFFHGSRKVKSTMHKNIKRLVILKSDVKMALIKIDKVEGLYGIVIMLAALDDFRID